MRRLYYRQDFLKVIRREKKHKPLSIYQLEHRICPVLEIDDITRFIAKKDRRAYKRFMEGDDEEGNNLYDWMIFAEDGTQLGFPIDAEGMAPTYKTAGVMQTLKDMKKVAFVLHRFFDDDLSVQLMADVTGVPVITGMHYGSYFLVVNPGDDLYKRVEFIRTLPGRTENGSIMVPFDVDIKSKKWQKGFEDIMAPNFIGLPKQKLRDSRINTEYKYKKSVYMGGTGGTRSRMDPTGFQLLGMLADKNPTKVLQIFNYYKDWFEKDKASLRSYQLKKFLEMIKDLKAGKKRKKQQKKQTRQQVVLKGKNIVVTGTIEGMTRAQVAKKIKELGGTLQSGVTKETDVVIKSQKPGKSKIDKAKEYGIKVVPYKQVSDRIK